MTYAVKSTLPDGDLKTVGEALQGALVDLVDLSLVAKQIHWNVVGPRFRSIHLQLDDVVDTGPRATPTRSRSARPRSASRRTAAPRPSPPRAASTRSPTAGRRTPTQCGRWSDALEAVIAGSRERMKSVSEPDPVTEDIFIQLTGDLEKHHWMFQAENGS